MSDYEYQIPKYGGGSVTYGTDGPISIAIWGEEMPVDCEAKDCMIASQPVLSRDWETPEEDTAWMNL